MATSNSSGRKSLNVNDKWKVLDDIFKCQLRQYVVSNNKEKFNEFSKLLSFNNIQTDLLWDSIECSSPPSPHHSKSPNQRQRSRKRRKNNFVTPIKSKKRRMSFEESIREIETILDHQQAVDEKYEYKVKWVGDDDMSWEPAIHLNGESIREYWEQKGFKYDTNNGDIEPLSVKKMKSKTKLKKKKKKKKKSLSVGGPYQCSKCEKSFASARSLNGHQAVHSEKRKKRKSAKPKDVDHQRETQIDYVELSD